MIIYALCEGTGEDGNETSWLSVWSSEEKAAAAFNKKCDEKERKYGYRDEGNFFIEEYEVDPEISKVERN